MGVTSTESHEGPEEPRNGRAVQDAAPTDEAPTDQLFVGSVGGDRCASCGSPLAADQRYCIQCGERRGKSRFSPAGMAGPPPPAVTDRAAPAPGEPPRRRGSYGPTLVAGIATLLVAMGVGVEIGRVGQSGNPNPRPAPAQVITVNGGGGAAAAATTTAAPGASPTKAAHTGKAQSKKAKAAAAAAAPKPTQKAVQKASKAASGVLGGSAGQQNSTVTTGQSCASGTAGCSGGHFSGTFFGGG